MTCYFSFTPSPFFTFFFFSDTATTEIYTLSLHDALPISAIISGWVSTSQRSCQTSSSSCPAGMKREGHFSSRPEIDRKSTRLNSSHVAISYAVFCLKKKKKITPTKDQRQLTRSTENQM